MKTQHTHTHERARLHKSTHTQALTRWHKSAHAQTHTHTLTRTLLPPFALGNSWWLLHNLLVQLFPGFHFLLEYQRFTLRSAYLPFGSYRGNIPIREGNPDSFLLGSVWVSINHIMERGSVNMLGDRTQGGGWERQGSHLKLPATSRPQRWPEILVTSLCLADTTHLPLIIKEQSHLPWAKLLRA